MEFGRMPLPATRHSTTDVDTTGNKGPHIEACSYSQIGSLLWSSKCEKWQISPAYVRQVQCRNFQNFLEEAVEMPFSRQAHSDSFGQCSIPPCGITRSIPKKISPSPKTGVFASIQPRVGSYRTSMEACQATCNAQPVFCNTERACRCCQFLLRSVEKTKSYIAKIMRHKLSRYV